MLKTTRLHKAIRKICLTILLLIIISWTSVFLYDYFTYPKREKPLVTLKTNKIENQNDYIYDYISFGYLIRVKNINGISSIELKPFWSKAKLPSNKDKYPEIKSDDTIENNEKLEKIGNTLFFYENDNLIMTYQCLNTKEDCHVATSSSTIENNHLSNLPFARYQDYVFIDDSTEKEKIIYIVNVRTKKIKYQTANVVASTKTDTFQALGVNGDYIVVDQNDKYSIINLGNEITAITPNVYSYIQYNEQSNTYITHHRYWVVTDLKTNYFTSTEPLADAFKIDNQLYIKKIIYQSIAQTEYKFYRLLNTDRISIFNNDYFLIDNYRDFFITIDRYLTLNIKNLKNENLLKKDLTTYINPATSTKKPYFIYTDNDNLILDIYYEDQTKVDRYFLDQTTYAIKKTEKNVSAIDIPTN